MSEACAGRRPNACRRSSRARGSTAISTSGSAMPTTTGPGASSSMRAGRSIDAWPGVSAESLARGAGGDAHRRRQRLVLVVRRRPFLRPRPRIRRAVPPARPERLSRARQADPGGAARHQHHHSGSRRRDSSAHRVHRAGRSTARSRSYFEWVGVGLGGYRRFGWCHASGGRSATPGSRSSSSDSTSTVCSSESPAPARCRGASREASTFSVNFLTPPRRPGRGPARTAMARRSTDDASSDG